MTPDEQCMIHDGDGWLCELPEGHEGDHSFNLAAESEG